MPRKVRRKSRRVGRGFGDFLGSSLAGIGGGLGQGVHDLFGNLFGGKKMRKVRRRRRRGGAAAGEKEEASLLSKINKVAKDSQVVSKALAEFGAPQFAQTIAGSLGYGKRKKMKGGMMLMPRAYNVPIVGMGSLGRSMGNLHL